ncbi:MAG: hypothetical protein QXP55_02295 [Nitrososphaerales archaeon]
MKPNYIGIIGGILAFISLALAWWTLSLSVTEMGITISGEVSIYPYQAKASMIGLSETIPMDIWFGWAALILIVIGGLLGIVGSVTKYSRKFLISGGLLALLSIIIFAAGLQMGLLDLQRQLLEFDMSFTGLGLFSSGTINLGYGIIANYSTYLSFGFWLALVAAIVMLIAALRKVEVAPPILPPPPPPPT